MECVTLAEAKEYLRLDADYALEDGLIISLIKAAQTYCEKYTGLSFTPRQLQMFTDKQVTDLLYGPVNAIISVKNSEGIDVAFTSIGLQHPRVMAPCNSAIKYMTGYDPDTLPELLKTAVKMMVATLYDNRENNATIDKGSLVEMPIGVTDLLRPYSRSGGLFL